MPCLSNPGKFRSDGLVLTGHQQEDLDDLNAEQVPNLNPVPRRPTLLPLPVPLRMERFMNQIERRELNRANAVECDVFRKSMSPDSSILDDTECVDDPHPVMHLSAPDMSIEKTILPVKPLAVSQGSASPTLISKLPAVRRLAPLNQPISINRIVLLKENHVENPCLRDKHVKGRLSFGTPLTPDALVDWARGAHTPKSTPRKPPGHQMKKTIKRVVHHTPQKRPTSQQLDAKPTFKSQKSTESRETPQSTPHKVPGRQSRKTITSIVQLTPQKRPTSQQLDAEPKIKSQKSTESRETPQSTSHKVPGRQSRKTMTSIVQPTPQKRPTSQQLDAEPKIKSQKSTESRETPQSTSHKVPGRQSRKTMTSIVQPTPLKRPTSQQLDAEPTFKSQKSTESRETPQSTPHKVPGRQSRKTITSSVQITPQKRPTSQQLDAEPTFKSQKSTESRETPQSTPHKVPGRQSRKTMISIVQITPQKRPTSQLLDAEPTIKSQKSTESKETPQSTPHKVPGRQSRKTITSIVQPTPRKRSTSRQLDAEPTIKSQKSTESRETPQSTPHKVRGRQSRKTMTSIVQPTPRKRSKSRQRDAKSAVKSQKASKSIESCVVEKSHCLSLRKRRTAPDSNMPPTQPVRKLRTSKVSLEPLECSTQVPSKVNAESSIARLKIQRPTMSSSPSNIRLERLIRPLNDRNSLDEFDLHPLKINRSSRRR